ncbi:MAG: DMT family transporter [Flavobacteriales bacterium]|nr:DMT family transporter [Flavobacteriales bacterium]
MAGNFKYQFILQCIVLVWGFTGILGDQIQMDSEQITFFRTAIACLSLLLIIPLAKSQKHPSLKQIVQLLGVGIIVGVHWFAFFYAIKVSNVSVAVVCMASSTLFTSLLEPLLFGRKFLPSELFLSISTLIGIIAIFGFEFHYYLGICFGLLCAFLGALFTVINGRLTQSVSSLHITFYEMMGGCLTMAVFMAFSGKLNGELFNATNMDWIYLLILGIVCTSIAFMSSVWVMKHVSPFSVSISLNMEPIYTILLAVLIDYLSGTNKEQMSVGFYVGGGIIILAIFVNAYLKSGRRFS